MTDTQAVIDDIAAGHHDGQLGELLNALFGRAAETETEFGWRIRLGDDEWTAEDVTLAELAFAERHIGESYLHLNPIRFVDHLVALIVAHLMKARGLKSDAAIKAAAAFSAADLGDMVSQYEVVRPPKGDGSTSATS